MIKYKPMYNVTISGEEIGYVQDIDAFSESLKNEIIENEDKNVDSISISENPEYELKLVDRTLQTNEEDIAETVAQDIKDDLSITYKYYDIALNNETIDSVDTFEEAEQIVNDLNQQKNDEDAESELNLSIIEKYTTDKNAVKTDDVEVAKNNIQTKLETKIQEEKERKEEEERIKNMPDVNGIKLATAPIEGTITSRFGESSRLRVSTHTGLDIGAKTGTPIKVVAAGTVISAKYTGSYGNLVKIDHGNGVETWYGHTSKMYVKAGQQVSAGEVIAAVGSTGNSTGPHLHFEIRVNGNDVDPQNYLYK